MQDAAVKYETVLAAVKREHGFPVADGRVQRLALFLGDVWRIARDKIKILHPERGRGESVRLERNGARIEPVQGDILARNGKRLGAYIGKNDARLREIDAQRAADASAAAAEIEDPRFGNIFQNFQCRENERLGIHAGNEYRGRYDHFQPEKLPFSGDIRQRLAGKTPLQKLLRGLFRLVTGVHIHPCNELRVGISGALREQTPGFERIFFHAGLLERAAHGEIQLIIGLCQS